MIKSVKSICLLLTLVMCIISMPVSAVAQDDVTLRIVSSNVLFDDTRDTVYRMHCLAETYDRIGADIICLQEARPNQMNALYPLMDDYERVNFSGVQDELMYQQMLYRKGKFTVEKSGFTRFREGVIPWGVSWAIFRRNSDGKCFAVMSTHLTIISDTYDKGASNSVEGVRYRKNDCNTILALITTLRSSYVDIPVVVCGDWNAQVGAVELDAIDNSAFMRDAMNVATVKADTKTSTAHKICRMPSSNGGDIIDHIYVSVDTLEVLTHEVIADGVVIQGSDHCPVVAQVKFK